ncbi:MAG: fmn-dependent monooxygenase [Deltaproteobacteria bacterium]|nr:fmn-dependent monooxygenase [Deltaproteobacteria bacterium]
MARFALCLGIYGVENFYGGAPSSIVQVVQQAEHAGFDQCVMTDHVVMGERLDRYPYGQFLTPPEYQWWEPMTTLAVIAGVTKTIQLSHGVLIAPLRSAVLLAKQAATLDQLSGGRLVLGVGTGWQREEYAASGIPFRGRTRRLIEQIKAMKTLWREAPACFHGETVSFERIYCKPFPAQANGIPVWVGIVASEENIEWMAEITDGWIPIQQDPAAYGPAIQSLRRRVEAHGRDPRHFAVRAQVQPQFDSDGKPDLERTLQTIPSMLKAGVTHVEILPCVFVRTPEEMDAFMDRLSRVKQEFGA